MKKILLAVLLLSLPVSARACPGFDASIEKLEAIVKSGPAPTATAAPQTPVPPAAPPPAAPQAPADPAPTR